MRFLPDTGPAQKFLNKHPDIRSNADRQRRLGNKIGICTPVLGELWSGVEGSDIRDSNLRKLKHGLSRLIVWPYDNDAAAEYGRIFTQLKQMGRPMQQVDIQIAAIALSLGNCTVVTTDSDLSAVSGLNVENWEAT